MKWIILLMVTIILSSMVHAQLDERLSGIVIQSVSKVINESIICGNNICQEGENHLNCPDDCGQEIKETNIFVNLLIIMFVFYAIINTRRKK